MLTAEQLAGLTAGLPDLTRVGGGLLVPMTATRIPGARVLWTNSGWFRQRGLDLTHVGTQELVHRWLISEFAIRAAFSPQDAAECPRTVYADRYGTAHAMSPHGGSGRAAMVGYFNVKGIGRTPLVGKGATWVHSHGLVTIGEAVSEAIHAEVLGAELPFGAVPVIAILDADERVSTASDGDTTACRALIVRPGMLRPAHMLRAPIFVAPTDSIMAAPGSDARRVHGAIAFVSGLSSHDRSLLGLPSSVEELCRRLCQQAAWGDALRLFTGGLFGDNVSLTGAVLDFGVARAMDSWVSVQLHAHAAGYGHDLPRILDLARMIRFYAVKAGYAQSTWFRGDIEPEILEATYEESLAAAFAAIWSADELTAVDSNRIVALTRGYFASQQKIRRRERWDGTRPGAGPWLYDALVNDALPWMSENLAGEGRLLKSVTEVFSRANDNHTAQTRPRLAVDAWTSAERFLRPRPLLSRTYIESAVDALMPEFKEAAFINELSVLMENIVKRSRRHWPKGVPGADTLEPGSRPTPPAWWIASTGMDGHRM